MADRENYDYPAILEAQEKHFSTLMPSRISSRIIHLERLADVVKNHEGEILEALEADLGKPETESYLSEFYFVLSEIRHVLKHLKSWAKPKRVRNPFYFFPARSEIRYEPLGTSLIVAPWNYPFQLSISPLIASVAAGNCVVLKPSELAPATAEVIAGVISSVFEPDHVRVITGGKEVGEALMKLPFCHWFFTGSETVGRHYARAAAEHLAPCVLELGGKSPCVLDSEIDLEQTVERIASTKFFNAGQTCMAPDFVLVPETLHDDFIAKLEAELRRRYPEGVSPDMSRIVNEAHFQRIRSLISEDAVQVGDDAADQNYLAPRILPRTGWNDRCMEEEIFGPVLPVIPYQDLNEAISRLQKMSSPLALYVFSRNDDFLESVAAKIPSGSVCFNDAIKQATVPDLPFGGVGGSGMGRYRGRAGFESFSYARAVTKRYFFKDLFAISPPYGDRLEKLRRFMK